ncbi:hypothetical protein BSLG_006401 [Batrachochytrium salamandrivorans]|nr:hypothetical protein BASA83_008401 [Batrachochytrium salamandrivorans]KAJ1339267.1 hypothetical protein BSLG_006401 [Batrachochytrium salamandrivorans]
MSHRSQLNDPLVWIDLEMTGLDLNNHTIIEIACVITDGNLCPVKERVNVVIHQPESVMNKMDEWCIEQHGKSGLTRDVASSTTSLSEAEATVLAYIKRYIPTARTGVLAGSSVHVDRQFLCKYMPSLVEHLHYRIVDISSIKELAYRWYPNFQMFDSQTAPDHRAMGDILLSISTLKQYRSLLFKPTLP